MRDVLLGCTSATVFAAALALGSSVSLAQSEGVGGQWGEGPDRVCNVVVDTNREVVKRLTGDDAVRTFRSFGCPEEEVDLAVVEPAAPADLPEAGVIYFGFDRDDLSPEAQAALEDIIFDIRDRELGGIISAGHTDTAGPADYNMDLSRRRAETVARELIRAGIPSDIIVLEAFGETDLAVPTPDNTPEPRNRRVVIEFE